VVIGPPDSVLEFQISDLIFRLVFSQGEGHPRLEGQPEEDTKRLTLKLINYNNAIGTGFQIPVGTLNDRELIFAVSVYAIGGEQGFIRNLIYSFSLGRRLET
jgi:hypothetical protein